MNRLLNINVKKQSVNNHIYYIGVNLADNLMLKHLIPYEKDTISSLNDSNFVEISYLASFHNWEIKIIA